MATPILNIAISTRAPKNLDDLDSLVRGLQALANVHDVPHTKVRTEVSNYGGGSPRLDIYWSTPAII